MWFAIGMFFLFLAVATGGGLWFADRQERRTKEPRPDASGLYPDCRQCNRWELCAKHLNDFHKQEADKQAVVHKVNEIARKRRESEENRLRAEVYRIATEHDYELRDKAGRKTPLFVALGNELELATKRLNDFLKT